MYKSLVRPLLFKMYPETVHELVVGGVKTAHRIPGLPWIMTKWFEVSNAKLETDVLGLHFKNPVGLAAGFDKNASFYNEFSAFGFGFIEIGTVTPKPQSGNPKPRSFRLPADKALINRMGFNNSGVDVAAQRLRKRKPGLIIGGNIGKNTLTPNCSAPDDYLTVFKGLYDVVDYFVVNVSCPNVSNLKELQDKEALTQILGAIAECRKDQTIRKPVLLKIAPDLNNHQIDDVLNVVTDTGIDGIVAANTSISREGLQTDIQRIQAIGNGGLSGAPLKQRSTEIIRHISKQTSGKLPIIGVGGIMRPEDALEKLEAGASLIQIYSGFIYEGPALVKRINKAILKAKG
jgi:dihydroorotate dehydrogenase